MDISARCRPQRIYPNVCSGPDRQNHRVLVSRRPSVDREAGDPVPSSDVVKIVAAQSLQIPNRSTCLNKLAASARET